MDRVEQLRIKLGAPSERAQSKVLDSMTESIQNFIKKSPFAILSTCNSAGDCDASPKGGKPGFVTVLGEKSLLIPDFDGNRLFQSYKNILSNPKAALIFMIPGKDITVRVNGHVRIVENEYFKEKEYVPNVNNSNSNLYLKRGLFLTVSESYFHCPKAFRFSDFWNVEVIEENRRK
ncbi:MAG: pyridoxamine 5'-phosphate oxidase family protein [Deltaproteobacteria bacterium]|nr:pyridoxamine 5'-phosphate oxidase family protein [Deltaproteobacteria bacterium]